MSRGLKCEQVKEVILSIGNIAFGDFSLNLRI